MSSSMGDRHEPARVPVQSHTFFDRRRWDAEPQPEPEPELAPVREGSGRFGQFVRRVAWLALAVAFALGSAGAVTALQPPPDGTNRPELTWGADALLSARLDGITHELVLLKGDVDILGNQTRAALSALAQVNQVALTEAWNQGANSINSIEARRADLNGTLGCQGWNDAFEHSLGLVYRADLISRYHDICNAIASVEPLKDDWDALVAGTETAMRVASDITDHDTIAAAALQLATQGRYPDALAQLQGATDRLADASTIAANLSKVADLSTLQDWLARTTTMDQALNALWQAMVASKGRITAQVTAALRNVNAAEAQLPNDAAVLQIVLHELAGSLTSSGISIETARGALAVAVGDLVGETVVGQ